MKQSDHFVTSSFGIRLAFVWHSDLSYEIEVVVVVLLLLLLPLS